MVLGISGSGMVGGRNGMFYPDHSYTWKQSMCETPIDDWCWLVCPAGADWWVRWRIRHAEATPPGSEWVSEMALPQWQRSRAEEEGEGREERQLTPKMAAHTCFRSTHGWLQIPPPAAASGGCGAFFVFDSVNIRRQHSSPNFKMR